MKTAITIEELARKIYGKWEVSNEQIKEVRELVQGMKEQKLISCVNDKKELYMLNTIEEGTIKIKRNGDAYVYISKYGDIQIEKKNVNGSMDGDKVLIRITDLDSLSGVVKDIVERKGKIAEVKTVKDKRYAVINEKEMYRIDLPSNIVDGTIIGIKVDKAKADKYYLASLDKVIGHKNSPRLEDEKIMYEFGIKNDKFSKEVMLEVQNINYEISEEEIRKRRDLRNKMIFTIDGADTKDIDDAISIEILENGNYKLGVHIADVTHYVKEGSAIDIEAKERGTSVYMPGSVSPMYPRELSNGICSLNPDVDRFALTCEMEIDNTGKVVDYEIFESVIHSKMQMTYDNVNKILEDNVISEGYEEYISTLKQMKELSDILLTYRQNRGMLDFDAPEIKINVDENNKVVDISERKLRSGESLIEYFMLVANETVATHMFNNNYNFIYRVHDLPNEDKLKEVITYLKNISKLSGTTLSLKDPKVIQKMLSNLKADENFDIYVNMILRCMAKAIYDVENTGHYGIGVKSKYYEAYTHFTSPIRRYPDTMVHRLLKMFLHKEYDKLESNNYLFELKEIAVHASEMEQLADECERAADKMRMAQYMEQYIGKDFTGRILVLLLVVCL
jgi:ribonuclease R